MQVVQLLTDLDLVIKKAHISSDGGWFVDGEWCRVEGFAEFRNTTGF